MVFIYTTSLSGNSKPAPSLPNLAAPMVFALMASIAQARVHHGESIFRAIYSNDSIVLSSALASVLIMVLMVSVKMIENFKGALIKNYI